ncbi:MAG: hypothetical protein AAFQ79_17840 [Pseudomonadota bacterium]
MKTWIKTVAKTLWRHRTTYAALALAYGCGCFGVIDKDTVAQIATGLYIAMVAQNH